MPVHKNYLMALHLTRKNITILSFSFALIVLLSAAFFWRTNIFSWLHKDEVIHKEKIVIDQAPSVQEKVDNALYKKIDFINKLIADFKLNDHVGKDLYYKKGSSYQSLSLNELLRFSIKDLAEARVSLEQNGLFFKDKDGSYITREAYDKKKTEQNSQKL